MNIIKQRSESEELLLFRSLNVRMKLTVKDVQHYWIIEKGFEGEQNFDLWVEKNLKTDCLILNDLLLKYNNTYFQIDTIVFYKEVIYLFDVKNYEGDFYIENEKWYSTLKGEIKNPLPQLERCESLLRRLLHDLGYNFPIESTLIFINSEFHLYHAPQDLPIIFPAQLNRFMKKLNSCPSKINDRHYKCAEKLLSLHIKKSPFTLLPEYNYESLEKGIICSTCNSIMTDYRDGKIVCFKCGFKEDVKKAVLRSVEELQLLFPERKITVTGVQEWCKILSMKTIRKIICENFELVSCGRSSYYVYSTEKGK